MATTKKERAPATPEQKTMRKASKLVAFTNWRVEWRAANPEATKEDRKEAWAKARKAEIRAARKAVKALHKGGMLSTPAEA